MGRTMGTAGEEGRRGGAAARGVGRGQLAEGVERGAVVHAGLARHRAAAAAAGLQLIGDNKADGQLPPTRV